LPCFLFFPPASLRALCCFPHSLPSQALEARHAQDF
jgi:hypothetical protein